jgi:glycolate oxidase FAD binding subunit
MLRPETPEQASAAIREHAAEGRILRARGGGTKLGWGAQPLDAFETIDIDTRGLDRIVEHNAGDFTAVLDAGVTLAEAQATFASAGQMLALDPPLGEQDAATIGGILATRDSGPLRHRYGGVRDLVIGITVVLSDGTIAKSGGKVIKNVAGYDLTKLFAGSFGTLGLITRVAVRLHPSPAGTCTLHGASDDANALCGAAMALARLPLEADCLDVEWSDGAGALLTRFAGAAADRRARAAMQHIATLDNVHISTDDAGLWARQRATQRAPDGIVLHVAGRPTDLPAVLRAAGAHGGTVVSRAALGLSWIALPDASGIAPIRRALAPRACTVLDGAARVSDPWPHAEPAVLAVMRRVKARFDPAKALAPGTFVGGI